MIIRRYEPEDCRRLTELFYHTVHAVNAKDYTKEQLDAWAPENVDLDAWNQSLSAHDTVVAFANDTIVGFGDINQNGYLDRLFIHKEYQKQGIATVICDELEKISASKISTETSITAKPFFEKRGYKVVQKQCVERNGVCFINYLMEKSYQ